MSVSATQQARHRVFGWLQSRIGELLGRGEVDMPEEATLMELGLDSAQMVELAGTINETFSVGIRPEVFFEFPALGGLADFIAARWNEPTRALTALEPGRETGAPASPAASPTRNEASPAAAEAVTISRSEPRNIGPSRAYRAQDIAIIGIGLHFPQANSVDEFWRLICGPTAAVSEFPYARLRGFEGLFDPGECAEYASYIKGAFADVAAFDTRFFNISPREADLMDPQQRLILSCVWHALEDAGWPPSRLSTRATAVIVGVSGSDYQELACRRQQAIDPLLGTCLSHAMLANRISYLLNLTGVSEVVDTACSSSLVAINRAVELLRHGRCDIAVAGGVNVLASLTPYIVLAKAGMLSKDGACRPFDAGANGYVRGEGAAAVVLTPIARALEDGDHVYAVIKGSAVNHGGKTQSLTAPSPVAQAEVIKAALKDAEVSPGTVGYVEAHGTGTQLGDPVELSGLTRAFAAFADAGHGAPSNVKGAGDEAPCVVGSVKGHIGHLEGAAGIAGLLKVVAAMRAKALPPTCHFTVPNELLRLEETPFRVINMVETWPRRRGADGQLLPRRAGVSSFGFGGTNAHVVLEEYPDAPSPRIGAADGGAAHSHLFVLSARTEVQLRLYAESLERFCRGLRFATARDEDEYLEALTSTLQTGREPMDARLAFVTRSVRHVREALADFLGGKSRHRYHMQFGEGKRLAGDGSGTEQENEAGQSERPQGTAEPALEAAARAWVSGAGIDWAALFPPRRRRIVPLPVYPFAAEAHWLSALGGPATSDSPFGRVRAAEPSRDVPAKASTVLLTRSWTRRDLPECNSRAAEQAVVVLTPQGQDALFDALRAAMGARLVVARDAPQCVLTDDACTFSWGAPGQRERFVEFLFSREVAARSIVDLSALAGFGDGETRDPLANVFLWQTLIAESVRSRTPLQILHVTRGLQAFRCSRFDLTGAHAAGFARMLGAEYALCTAKTLDLPERLDPGIAGTADGRHSEAVDAARIAAELRAYDGYTEICYRGDERFVITFERTDQRTDGLRTRPADPSRPALITGGLGALGLTLARHLVGQGYRKLILVGRSRVDESPAFGGAARSSTLLDKRVALESLKAEGADVEYFAVGDAGRDGLRRFLAEARARLGMVGQVFHLAGRLNRNSPAFVKKSPEEMRAVFAAKVDLLRDLFDLLHEEEKQHVVLFSSISSAVPKLAVGISDYAAANAWLDFLSQHLEAGGRGRCTSIQWASWAGPGMGKQAVGQSALGLRPIPKESGLAALDALLAGGAITPVACVCGDEDAIRALDARVEKVIEARPAGAAAKSHARDAVAPTTILAGEPNDGVLIAAVTAAVRRVVSAEIEVDEVNIDADVPLETLGVDSVIVAGIVGRLEQWLGGDIDPSEVLLNPTVAGVAAWLFTARRDAVVAAVERDRHVLTRPAEPESRPTATGGDESVRRLAAADVSRGAPTPGRACKPVAVVGVACHFPGARDKEAFWKNLAGGVDSVVEVPPDRWDLAAFYAGRVGVEKSVSKWGGFISDVDQVDPVLFSVPTEDAADIDPLMRIFLEIAVGSILDSGYSLRDVAGRRVGVFAGARSSNYVQRLPRIKKSSIVATGQNFIASHVAQTLNLRGPSLVVDTACSSSLMAIHLACQSLHASECTMALAGGTEILLDEKPYLFLSAAQALSPSGHCFTFDERADGFVPGEGAGCVALKMLEQAEKDGDRIYAVVEGSAANNDGRTMGITTPSIEGQADVITRALALAGRQPDEVSYVETHGTGTMIGDPVELRALTQAFAGVARRQCGVGSVKTNIGHLLSAAGVASFIKMVLSLYHKMKPPTLHCERLNPRFNFEQSPFYPVTALESWPAQPRGRAAGVSAFGFGGTNVHVVLSEGPASHAHARRTVAPGVSSKISAWHPAPTTGNGHQSAEAATSRQAQPVAGTGADDGRRDRGGRTRRLLEMEVFSIRDDTGT